jgi:hypothetical protein
MIPNSMELQLVSAEILQFGIQNSLMQAGLMRVLVRTLCSSRGEQENNVV